MIPGPRVEQPDADRLPGGIMLRAFDYLAAACFGAAAAVAAWMFVPTSVPGIVEMVVGMLIGMLSALPLFGLFSWILGGFEIVVLFGQVGMFAGMLGVMSNSDTAGDVAFEGILLGLLVQMLIHGLDRSLGGEVRES